MLACCHDEGYDNQFQVLLRNDENYTVELRLGWDTMCEVNNFRPGIIRFKFTTNNPHCMCHVYQLSVHGSASASASNPAQ